MTAAARGLRWPKTPQAWLALALFAPIAAAAGAVAGFLSPLVALLSCLAPI